MKITELLESYKGEHEAPSNDGFCKPIYNLSGIYPDDIYSSNAVHLYGDDSSFDSESIHIIQSLRNKPKSAVKIFRAVPYDNTRDKYIKELKDLLKYYEQFKFFPIKNKIVDELEAKYQHLSYNESVASVINDIQQQISQPSTSEKITINSGVLVTISKAYAVEHGKYNLKGQYKIISKPVSAKHVWSDGNSIHEFGYDQG